MSSFEDDVENTPILRIDPCLAPYKDHFIYRLGRYVEQKKLIENYEGGLEEFARGSASYLHLYTCVISFKSYLLNCDDYSNSMHMFL